MADRIEKVVRRFEKLKGARVNWDQHWREIAELVIPRKDDIFRTRIPGEKKNRDVFDSTAIHANETLAAALQSLLTNPTIQFFELTTGDPEIDKQDDVREWLQDTVRRIHEILNNTNFHTEIHQVYIDLGAFGTSLLFIEEDKNNIINFRANPIYEAYIDVDSKDQVNTVFRLFQWNIKQMRQEFGDDVLSEEDIRVLGGDLDKMHWVIHAVEPINTLEPDEQMISKKGFKWKSEYILQEKRISLSMGGFKEFPYIVSRWTKISSEKYGRSPSMKALPDIKMINEVMKVTIRSAQKTVDPPLLAPDDGVFRPFRIVPGGITYYRAGTADRIEPLDTGSRVDFGFQFIEQLKEQIKQAYFVDQLRLPEGPQKTATEVLQLVEENSRIMGPIMGRQQFELLSPMIDRIFNIMIRKNMLLPFPEILSETNLRVQYSSLIARSQRTTEAENLARAIAAVGPIVEAAPEALDIIDADEALRTSMKLFGVDQRIFKKTEEIEAEREARAQLAEQQRQAELEAQQAQNIQAVGPTILQSEQAG